MDKDVMQKSKKKSYFRQSRVTSTRVEWHSSALLDVASRVKKSVPDFDTPGKSYGRIIPQNFHNPAKISTLTPLLGVLGRISPITGSKLVKYAIFGVLFCHLEVGRSL